MKDLGEAPLVDVFSPEFQADPAAVITPLREKTGVVRTPLGALVIRRSLVQGLLADRRLRESVADFVRMQSVTEGQIHDLVASGGPVPDQGDVPPAGGAGRGPR